ncbi:MAG: NAD(P)-binding protein, partial [Bacilli bacterium]|nr:NAD(P)-binding protein [Bacilli bacterium]
MEEKININEIVSGCLSCPKPRCEIGCPVGNHIRDFIKAIKNGKLDDAADILYAQNPYPELTCRLCDFSRNCMGHCVKSFKGEGIPCYLVERYISDHVKRSNAKKEDNGYRIGIIGAGISGLTAAKILAMEGYHVEIFEKEHQVGGAIYTGIPDYRFDKKVLDDIQQELLDLGVIIHFGVLVGKDVTLDNILFRFDRLLIAIGAEAENKGGFEGKEGF